MTKDSYLRMIANLAHTFAQKDDECWEPILWLLEDVWLTAQGTEAH